MKGFEIIFYIITQGFCIELFVITRSGSGSNVQKREFVFQSLQRHTNPSEAQYGHLPEILLMNSSRRFGILIKGDYKFRTPDLKRIYTGRSPQRENLKPFGGFTRPSFGKTTFSSYAP